MGIRHLKTFISKDVPNGIFDINLEQEIRKAQDPIVVIDLNSMYHLFTNRIEIELCGGDFKWAEEQADLIFSKLVSFGAKLVFFCDGPGQLAKHDTKIERKNERYRNCVGILRDIESGMSLATVASYHNNKYPQHKPSGIKKMAKKHGELYLSLEKEADLEMAAYAAKNNVLAILTEDSDFLIYEGNWRYWSAGSLDIETMITIEYNRKQFKQYLRLSYGQLRLFATLSGTDILRYDDVLPFHRKLGYPKFGNIANFIRKFDDALSQKDKDEILRNLFGSGYSREMEEKFLKSLESYNINYTPANIEQTKLQKILFDEEIPLVYNMLHGCIIPVKPWFFDYSKTDMGDYNELNRALVSKIAGVVLYHQRDKQDYLNIVVKPSHERSFELVRWTVVYPDHLSVPPLLELYSKDERMSKMLLDTKLKILCWLLSEKITVDTIKRIDPQYVTVYLVIYRLKELSFLTKEEGDLLLLNIYHSANKQISLSLMTTPTKLTSRGVRTAFIFRSFHSYTINCTKILGLPDEYRPSRIFIGVYYQNLLEQFYKVGNEVQKGKILAEVRKAEESIIKKH